ncbi:MAG: hypothetical protein WA484_13380 [Solirubrobacteraceae bacterium]
MRRSLALLATGLLGLTAVACGGTSKTTSSISASPHDAGPSGGSAATSASGASQPSGYLKDDGDADGDDGQNPANAPNDDLAFLATYGHGASPADMRAVTTLVKSYYAAAAAGEAARACSLLDSTLAAGLASGQSQAPHGPRDRCAASMAPLLRQQHQRLTAEDPATMTVIGVHVKGNLGLAVLGFRTMPEAVIVVEREGSMWKIDALFDNNMT